MNYLEIMNEIFLKIQKGKVNAHESRLLVIGLTFDLLQNRSVFKKNSDLRPFVEDIFVKTLRVESYKNYLYDSRTLLSSRISKDIYNCEFSYVKQIINELSGYFRLSEIEMFIKSQQNIKENDYLSLWIKYIRGSND